MKEEEEREYQRQVNERLEAQARVRKQLENTLIVEDFEDADDHGARPVQITI